MVPCVAVDIAAGLHVPVIPFVEVAGRLPGLAPTQKGPKAEKVGVTLEFTTTLIVVLGAHCPVVGVKV